MELKSYQNNSYISEDISLDISQNNKSKAPIICNNSVIKLTDISLTFGKKKVFERLNMTVPYGKIYSIIGPKKCGKTLILQSIAGLLKPTKGEIEVFDKKPEYSSAIGYMPQEMSLFDDLSIEETMKHFGQLYDLHIDLINNKIDFLVESLSINNKNILIRNLSNNDKVIVSLAVTILHSPQVLILDEPTINCDPLLKKSIWKQLRRLCSVENVTIIISTSHIEEAQHSDIVAFIRDGVLIQEEMPQHLTKEINLNSIEDLFLDLFEKNKFTQENNEKEKFAMNYNNNTIPINSNSFTDINLSSNLKKGAEIKTSSMDRISALYYKNLKSKQRNLHILLFQLLFPAIAISLFCACIGHNPYEIPIGVYNPDKPSFASSIILKSFNEKVISLQYYNSFESAIKGIRDHQVWALLSFPHNYTRSMLERSLQGCEPPSEEMLEYEDEISEESVIHNQHYVKPDNNTMKSINETNGNTTEGHSSEREVEEDESVKNKEIGIEGIGIEEEKSSDNEDDKNKDTGMDIGIEGVGIEEEKSSDNEDDREVNEHDREHQVSKPKLFTTIDLYMDNTNLLISGAIRSQLLKALKKARNRSAELSGSSSNASPIEVIDPMIYGSDEVEMSEFIIPGIIIAMVFLSSVLFPGLTIIKERKERLFERSTIAGVKVHELIISHLIIHIAILIIQIIFILICIFTIFKPPMIGSIYLVFLLIFIQGLNGLIYSITISSFCCDEIQAIIVWLTTFSVVLILGGIFWPIECMPRFAIFICKFLPQSISCDGLRSILSRGWGLSYFSIQLSLLLPTVWIIILFLISIFMFRIRK